MIKKIHACNKMNFSSNINEAIRAVLNSKSTKSIKTQPSKSTKNANKRTKIKNALKKHVRGKSRLFAYLRFCACKENNRKVSTVEMLVPLNQ